MARVSENSNNALGYNKVTEIAIIISDPVNDYSKLTTFTSHSDEK